MSVPDIRNTLIDIIEMAGGETADCVVMNPWDFSTLVGMLCSSPWHFRRKMREFGLNGLQIQRQLIAWRNDHHRRRSMKCGIWIRKAV